MPICRILLVLLAVATLPASEALVHVVRKGENLTTIAKSYGVTVDSVKKANNLRNADKIVVGQKLDIPGTAPKYIEYKVRKGESLSSIAAQHGLKAKEIGAYNDFDFKFRRKMIKNIPYLMNIGSEIVQDIICLMRPRRFESGTTIVKRGDAVDQIMLLKSGIIDVQVPVFQ